MSMCFSVTQDQESPPEMISLTDVTEDRIFSTGAGAALKPKAAASLDSLSSNAVIPAAGSVPSTHTIYSSESGRAAVESASGSAAAIAAAAWVDRYGNTTTIPEGEDVTFPSSTAPSGTIRKDTDNLIQEIFAEEGAEEEGEGGRCSSSVISRGGSFMAAAGRLSQGGSGSSATNNPRREIQRQMEELREELQARVKCVRDN